MCKFPLMTMAHELLGIALAVRKSPEHSDRGVIVKAGVDLSRLILLPVHSHLDSRIHCLPGQYLRTAYGKSIPVAEPN